MKYLLLILLVSCAQITSLNMRKHQFGLQPNKIIWIQVAGLNEEHLSFLKFDATEERQQNAFEQMTCYGKAWNFNLSEIRQNAKSSFLTQMTGSKDVRGNCQDYRHQPLWEYLKKGDYQLGIFEKMVSTDESLIVNRECPSEVLEFNKGATIWLTGQENISANDYFSLGDSQRYKANTTYYDKSCKGDECYTGLVQNVIKTYQTFAKNNKYFIYIVRDFSFQKYLRYKDWGAVRGELKELNSLVEYFQRFVEKEDQALLLVTSAAAQSVDFPEQGKAWMDLNKGRNLNLFRKTDLMNLVMAHGARAENFCGIYEEDQILSRILTAPKNSGQEFQFINPFN